jgi:hypothetical protein
MSHQRKRWGFECCHAMGEPADVNRRLIDLDSVGLENVTNLCLRRFSYGFD